MIDNARIHEHMEVIGSDGQHVGRVDKLMGTEIELAKLDTASGLKHHYIPLSWVESIENEKLCLDRTADRAKASWREMH
jgi:hypothetical protein